jgi:hypothetical protein
MCTYRLLFADASGELHGRLAAYAFIAGLPITAGIGGWVGARIAALVSKRLRRSNESL